MEKKGHIVTPAVRCHVGTSIVAKIACRQIGSAWGRYTDTAIKLEHVLRHCCIEARSEAELSGRSNETAESPRYGTDPSTASGVRNDTSDIA